MILDMMATELFFSGDFTRTQRLFLVNMYLGRAEQARAGMANKLGGPGRARLKFSWAGRAYKM